jgi:recombinational DNA repair ATPase RecF
MVLSRAGREPIVLLDDADAELDAQAVARLWEAFAGARQLLASTNRPEVFSSLETSTKWRLEDGQPHPA